MFTPLTKSRWLSYMNGILMADQTMFIDVLMLCLLSFNNEVGILTQTILNRLTVNSALSVVQVLSWKSKLPLQTIMRLLQVLVPQVEKICIDKYGNVQTHRYLYIY